MGNPLTLPLQSPFLQGQPFVPLSAPWAGALNDLLEASGAAVLAAAPDVADFAASVATDIQVAGLPYYRFSGTVTLAESPANTAEIDIVMTDGGGVSITVATLLGPFAGNAILDWTSVLYPEPTSGPDQAFAPTVVPLNGDMAPTVSAHTPAPLTVTSGTSSLGSGGGSLAPNVVAATCSVGYQAWADATEAVFSGTFTCPADATNLAHLIVRAFKGAKASEIARFDAGFSNHGVMAYSGASSEILETGTNQPGWAVQFEVYDAEYREAAIPFTLGGLTIGAAAITAVAAGEVPGTLVADPVTRLVSTEISCVPTFYGNQVAQNATYWLSQDNGATFVWMAWQLVTGVGQLITFMRVKPATAETWVVAMVAGAVGGDPTVFVPVANLPSGTVLSAGFLVSALALPLATDVTSLLVAAGAGGNNPYNIANTDGAQYFSIGGIEYNDGGAVADPNCFFIRVTAQDYGAAGTAVGPEQAYAGTAVSGGTQRCDRLQGAYGVCGYGYTRTAPIAAVRLRVYACNRADQTTDAWQNALCATLQTGVGSGAGYKDVTVAAGGNPPPGALVMSNASPDSVGAGLIVAPAVPGLAPSGVPKLRVGTGNNLTSALYDPSFWFMGTCGQAGLVSPSTIALWQFLWIGGGTIAIKTDGGYDDKFYCRLTGKYVLLSQAITVVPGESLNCKCWARSNNPTIGGGEAHYLLFFCDWFDASGAYLGWTTLATAAGYLSSWTQLGDYAAVPAGAAFCCIGVTTSGSEPDAGYFDVDTFFAQHVVNQTGGGQTANMQPASVSGDQSALQVYSGADLSKGSYGKNLLQLTAPDGITQMWADVFSGTAAIQVVVGGSINNAIGLYAENSGPFAFVVVGGVAHSGYTGPVAGRSSIGGIVV